MNWCDSNDLLNKWLLILPASLSRSSCLQFQFDALALTVTVTFSGNLVISFINWLPNVYGQLLNFFFWVSRYIISKITVKRNFKQKKKTSTGAARKSWRNSLYKYCFCSSLCFTVETKNDLWHASCSLSPSAEGRPWPGTTGCCL